MRLLHLAAVLALAACAGPRGPHANVPKNAWVDEDPETGDELICKDERTTGTNVSKVVCRTQDEIDEEHNAAMVWDINRRIENAKL